MMGTGSKHRVKEGPDSMRAASQELSFSPEFFWRLFINFAKYRIDLLVREVMVFPSGDAYYVCPRCSITLEHEFMSYCDRCGQRLGWKGYKKAKVIYPGHRKEVHI